MDVKPMPEIPAYVLWALPYLLVGIIVMFCWNSVVTVVLFLVAKRDSREVDFKKHIAELTDHVDQLATKLVEERIRHMSHELANEVNSFKLNLEHLTAQLKDTIVKAEKEIDELWDGDKEMEIALERKAGELQLAYAQQMNHLMEKFATKADLDRHRRENH